MLGLITGAAGALSMAATTRGFANASALGIAAGPCSASGAGLGYWWAGSDGRLFYTPASCADCDAVIPAGWPGAAAPMLCQVKGGQLHVAVANASGAGAWAIFTPAAAALPTSSAALAWTAIAAGSGGDALGFSFADGGRSLYVAVKGQGVTLLTRASTAAAFSAPALNPTPAAGGDVLVRASERRVYLISPYTLSFVDVAAGVSWATAQVSVMASLPADGSRFAGIALAPSA